MKGMPVMATIKTQTNHAFSPDVTALHAADVVPNALILQCSTVMGAVNGDAPSVRVAYVSDGTASFVAEAAAITPNEPALNERVVYTGKIAQLAAISREQYEQANTPAQLAQSLARAIVKRADIAFLREAAPVGPAVAPAAGLANVSGIEDGGTVATDFDQLIDLVAELESNGATPTHVVVDPLAYASLSKFKTGTGSNLGILGAGVEATERRILGLPVIVSAAMTANSGLILDSSEVISAVGPVNVSVSDHLYFNSDSIAVRATWRIGHSVVRPDRIGKFVVTDPDA